jgi:branched-chain amino acid transport system ATP-binding protein
VDLLLKVEGLSKSFGGVRAVTNYGLELAAGSICGLIGPNGAGKTTVINMLSGIIESDTGKVWFQEKDITARSAHEIAQLGIARTFQNLRLFKRMTVRENILVAAEMRSHYGVWGALLSLPDYRREERTAAEEVGELMRLLDLERFGTYRAADIPFGIQKRLEIARALASHPKLILFDEPASGMSATEARELGEMLMAIIRKEELTVLLVEHRVPLVMQLCERVQVMNEGRLIAEGPPEAVKVNEHVRRVYLGGVVT